MTLPYINFRVNVILTFASSSHPQSIRISDFYRRKCFSFTFSQGSNNSDQSSGYLSGSGGSNSLPSNDNTATVDNSNPFDFKYGPTRLDNLNDKFQGQQRNDMQNMKKLSLTSSLGDYCSSSNNEQDMEFGNGHK